MSKENQQLVVNLAAFGDGRWGKTYFQGLGLDQAGLVSFRTNRGGTIISFRVETSFVRGDPLDLQTQPECQCAALFCDFTHFDRLGLSLEYSYVRRLNDLRRSQTQVPVVAIGVNGDKNPDYARRFFRFFVKGDDIPFYLACQRGFYDGEPLLVLARALTNDFELDFVVKPGQLMGAAYWDVHFLQAPPEGVWRELQQHNQSAVADMERVAMVRELQPVLSEMTNTVAVLKKLENGDAAPLIEPLVQWYQRQRVAIAQRLIQLDPWGIIQPL